MEYSNYQQDVLKAVSSGSGHGAIVAVAGSGKSTILEKCFEAVPRSSKVLGLAFNKTIAEEMERRVKNRGLTNVEIRTYNSFCSRLLARQSLTFGRFTENKTEYILRASKYKDQFWDIIEPTKRAVSLLKNKAVVSHDLVYLTDLIEAEDLSDYDGFPEMAAHIFIEHNKADGLVDFDDQKYRILTENITPTKYDFVFVDEYQDTCPIEAHLIDKLIKRGARTFVVGDPDQAVYSFKGADSTSIQTFISKYSATELPLSICYRCSKAVIKEAQKIVPRIEACEWAEEGEVAELEKIEYLNRVTFDDMIIARNNSTLTRSCLEFFKMNRQARIIGKEVTASLFGLIDQLTKKENISATTILSRLDKRYSSIRNKLVKKKQAAALEELKGWAECLYFLLERPEVTDTKTLVSTTNNMFCNDNSLSYEHVTSHKSKGLETRNKANAYLLNPTEIGTSEEERRLLYVSITRSKQGGFYYVR